MVRATAWGWLIVCLGASAASVAGQADGVVDSNAIINSRAAAKSGKATYLRLCQYCHGADGKALENIDFEATNLTDPTLWRYGTEPPAIYSAISSGAGGDMPPFKTKLTERQIWELVAFIRSIGPEDKRPAAD